MGLDNDISAVAGMIKESKKVTIISHIDADGITSEAIMKQAVAREGIEVRSVFVRQVYIFPFECFPDSNFLSTSGQDSKTFSKRGSFPTGRL